jgi:23S rRNA (uracil1939-C5)-methyltransferase
VEQSGTIETTPWVLARMTGLAGAGRGIGPVEDSSEKDLVGIKAFVAGGLPGDLVRATLIQRKNKFVEGTLAEIVEPSPHRRIAPCPVVAECGGCDLQSLRYESQLNLKREMIIGAFRAARLEREALLVRPFEESAEGGYRRRFSFHIDQAGLVGLYRRGSRSVLPLSRCFVATDEVNSALEKLPLVAQALAGVAATAVIESGEGMVGIALVLAENISPQMIDTIAATLQELATVWSIRVRDHVVRESGGLGMILEVDGRLMPLPLGSFSQVNRDVNSKLVKRVVEIVMDVSAKRVLDLYAGAGNFAIPIASRGVTTTAVELVPELVGAAEPFVAKNGLPIEYRCISVEKFLRHIEGKIWDCIVVDPPRSGLGSVVSSLPKSRTVLLISCQLSSCVRDVKSLIERGYQVESIEPFDMFAQTSHAEILSVLRLGDEGY